MLIAMFAGVGLAAIAALPWWPYSRAWGYVPAVGMGLILLLLTVMHMRYMI